MILIKVQNSVIINQYNQIKVFFYRHSLQIILSITLEENFSQLKFTLKDNKIKYIKTMLLKEINSNQLSKCDIGGKQNIKTYKNPIFNKLNKIFVQPKIQDFKERQTNTNENNIYQQKRQNCYKKQQCVNSYKQQLITLETQPSSVFILTNKESNLQCLPKCKSIIEGLIENPLKTNIKSLQFDMDYKLNIKQLVQIDKETDKENSNIYLNCKTGQLNCKIGQKNKQQRYYYQNHKLNKIKKPLLVVPGFNNQNQPHISIGSCQAYQNSQKKHSFQNIPIINLNPNQIQQKTIQNKTNPQQIYEPQSKLSSYQQSKLSSHQLSSVSSSSPKQSQKIKQLQQRISYYQKMQQFYLNQIQTYRQDKKQLQWKLQIIVQQLLGVTMRQKIINNSSDKFNFKQFNHSMDELKLSKQLLIDKINSLRFNYNLSSNYNLQSKYNLQSNYNQQSNKSNSPLANSFFNTNLVNSVYLQKDSMNYELNNQINYEFNYQQINNKRINQIEAPFLQSFDTSDQYISSFRLQHVTLVESEDDEPQNQKEIQIQIQQRFNKIQKISSSTTQSRSQPHVLIFQ